MKTVNIYNMDMIAIYLKLYDSIIVYRAVEAFGVLAPHRNFFLGVDACAGFETPCVLLGGYTLCSGRKTSSASGNLPGYCIGLSCNHFFCFSSFNKLTVIFYLTLGTIR